MNDETREQALVWLEDCGVDVPEDVTDGELAGAIRQAYEGGMKQFVEDGR